VLSGVTLAPGSASPLLTMSGSGTLVYVAGASGSDDEQMVRVSRAGVVSPLDTAWHGALNSFVLSPDGRQIALGVGAGKGLNVWVKPVGAGPASRLTFGNSDRRPEWSPDGRLVAFIRDSLGTSSLSSSGPGNSVYVRPADGSGTDRRLAKLDRAVQEINWSHDGKWLILRTDNGARGAGDLIGIRVGGDTTPVEVVASQFTELHPALSPDGHWIAYASDESGTLEVYVRPFPNTQSGRWQISNGGGIEPRWSPDGRQIYFLDQGPRMMVAQVNSRGSFAVSDVQPLFTLAASLITDAFHQTYDVSPDGKTFYFMSSRTPRQDTRIVWAEHWLSDVRAKAGR